MFKYFFISILFFGTLICMNKIEATDNKASVLKDLNRVEDFFDPREEEDANHSGNKEPEMPESVELK